MKPTDKMQAVLDAHKALHTLPIETLDPETARQIPLPDRAALAVYGQHFTNRALASMPQPVGGVKHILMDGSRGPILARIYTPQGDMPKGGWPVLVYYHGGGWVIATLDTYDSSARALCEEAKCVVVSVHYRQAPEHKWPAAPEDAYDAFRWVQTHTSEIKGNSARIAISGESAGGNLAAVVCLMARANGVALPVHQLLVYPVTDVAAGFDSESARKHADAKPLNRAMLLWFYDHYLPKDADRRTAFISPLYVPNLSGLPDTTIINAEIDPLRSDGEAYAERLKGAGVPVEWKLYKGVTHEFFGMKGIVDEAGEAIAFAADRLKKAFSGSHPAAPAIPLTATNMQPA